MHRYVYLHAHIHTYTQTLTHTLREGEKVSYKARVYVVEGISSTPCKTLTTHLGISTKKDDI